MPCRLFILSGDPTDGQYKAEFAIEHAEEEAITVKVPGLNRVWTVRNEVEPETDASPMRAELDSNF
jgi:hypothetical protein